MSGGLRRPGSSARRRCCPCRARSSGGLAEQLLPPPSTGPENEGSRFERRHQRSPRPFTRGLDHLGTTRPCPQRRKREREWEAGSDSPPARRGACAEPEIIRRVSTAQRVGNDRDVIFTLTKLLIAAVVLAALRRHPRDEGRLLLAGFAAHVGAVAAQGDCAHRLRRADVNCTCRAPLSWPTRGSTLEAFAPEMARRFSTKQVLCRLTSWGCLANRFDDDATAVLATPWETLVARLHGRRHVDVRRARCLLRPRTGWPLLRRRIDGVSPPHHCLLVGTCQGSRSWGFSAWPPRSTGVRSGREEAGSSLGLPSSFRSR